MLKALENYITYLVHPFKTHRELLASPNSSLRLSPYESLCTSWLFVLINALFRIIILNFSIHLMIDFIQDQNVLLSGLVDINKFSTFYIFIFSSILDIIFYPLFGLFLIQFWTFIINLYGQLLGETQDIIRKTDDIIAVYLSSHFLRVIPFLGDSLQGFVALILLYSGLRVQLKASPLLSLCIIFTPILLLLILVSMIILLCVSFIY